MPLMPLVLTWASVLPAHPTASTSPPSTMCHPVAITGSACLHTNLEAKPVTQGWDTHFLFPQQCGAEAYSNLQCGQGHIDVDRTTSSCDSAGERAHEDFRMVCICMCSSMEVAITRSACLHTNWQAHPKCEVGAHQCS